MKSFLSVMAFFGSPVFPTERGSIIVSAFLFHGVTLRSAMCCSLLPILGWLSLCSLGGCSDEAKSLLIPIKVVGESHTLEVGGLVEGLAKGLHIDLRNDLSGDLTGLITNASCGCLRISDFDGSELRVGKVVRIPIVFIPTADRFEQSFDLKAKFSDGVTQVVSKVIIKGRVEPPIKLERTRISVKEFSNNIFECKLISNEAVNVDFSRIQSSQDWITAKGFKETSSIRLSLNKNEKLSADEIPGSEFQVVVPFEWSGRPLRYAARVEIDDQTIRVTPTHAYFQTRDSSVVFCKVILRASGLGVSLSDGKFKLKDRLSNSTVEGVDSKIRVISESTAQLEVIVPRSNIDISRQYDLDVVVGKYQRSIECKFHQL